MTNTNMNYHWNWSIFHEQVKGGDETNLDWLLTGFGWTAAVSLSVSEIAFIEKIVRPMDLASDLLEDVTVVEEDA